MAIALTGVIVLLGAAWLAYVVSLQAGLMRMADAASERLTLLAATLDANVERFRYLPVVLAQADPIRALYLDQHSSEAAERANRYLEQLNEAAGSLDLYVTDATGLTIAASNHARESSFVGQSYSFRPYFRNALLNGEGRYYAVGVTTGRPGYFLAHRVVDGTRTLGVAVVKVDLGPLEHSWMQTSDPVAMLDAEGIVFLSNRADWRYRPTRQLSRLQLEILGDTRPYGDAALEREPLFGAQKVDGGVGIVDLDDRRPGGRRPYAMFTRPLPTHGWTLVALSDVNQVYGSALIIGISTALAGVAFALVTYIVHQRRQAIRAKLGAHERLEVRVRERTAELTQANLRLSSEIEERRRVEADLRGTQQKLVQAAKLASLGQALAGVAHEINQPLAALSTYVASAKLLLQRDETDRVRANLDLMSSIICRMVALSKQLRTFARDEREARMASDLGGAVRNALHLVNHRLQEKDITLLLGLPDAPVHVLGNPIRIEQVVVNLVSNAADAMRDRPRRLLGIHLHRQGGSASLDISDTGHGIPSSQIHSVFDPFFTTKEVGQGLGLGLSISYGIVREMGGDLAVESELGVGTTFRVTIPVAEGVAATTGAEIFA